MGYAKIERHEPNIPGHDWRLIPGYSGDYWISNKGLVWASRTRLLCLLRSDKKGGLQVQLLHTRSGCLRFIQVHKLVAEAFLFKPNNAKHVLHINDDRMDNRAENLRWCTQTELTRELLKATLSMEDASMCSRIRVNLTEADAIAIRDAVATGASRRALALHYRVCYATICNIVRRDTWANV